MTDTIAAEPVTGFAALGLDARLVDALVARGYSEPTPIQREAIPPLLAGNDLIGLAATGTGKTAAFALPLLQRIAAAGPRTTPSVLVLVPTRELAIQVATAVARYGKPLNARVVAVYGGAGFGEQVRALQRGTDVVIATPGRALDHLRRGTLVLDGVTAVVLDEADEMLDMGFAEDIETLLNATPDARQTMLFSATIPPRISAIAAKYLTNPVRISVAKLATPEGEAPQVRQTIYLVPGDFRTAALARVLEYDAPTSAIVFCRTRHESESVADALVQRGFRPETLHGGLSQEQRDRVMRKFRDGATTLLVATDVAARGLDITQLSHVINFGVPQQAETYVHRIGRVGRAGREGVALTIADSREQYTLRAIEKVAGKFEYAKVPTGVDLQQRRRERTRDRIVEMIAAGGLDDYQAVVAELTGTFDPKDVALAAVALATTAGRTVKDGPDVPAVAAKQSSAPRPQRPVETRQRRGTPGMARVFVSAGRDVGLDRREVVNLLGKEVGLGVRDIGMIDVAERFCLVDIPEEACDEVISRLDGVRIKGRRVQVRRDRVVTQA